MIKRTVVLALAMMSSSVSAGTVAFDPPVQIVDPSVSTLASFQLSLSSATVPTFIAFTAVLGSDDLVLTDWQPGPVFPGTCPVGGCDLPPSTSFYPSSFKIGFSIDPSPVPLGELLGTLTVDAASLAPGDYAVVIDPDRDTGFSALTTPFGEEPISGVGIVRVVPEPASLILLGIGGFCAYLRCSRRLRLHV